MKVAVNMQHPLIMALHKIVCDTYGCAESEIHSQPDTHVKKVTVFILCHFFGYQKCDVARPYLINCLYVPTVVRNCQTLYAVSDNFRDKVKTILDYLELNYEETTA